MNEDIPLLTDQEANELLHRLSTLDAQAKGIEAQAKAIISSYANEARGIIFVHGDRLIEWAQRQRGPRKAKTIRTLYGTISFRTPPAVHEVTDRDAAIDFAIQYVPGAINLDRKMLAETEVLDTETGELMKCPGISTTIRDELPYLPAHSLAKRCTEDEPE